MLKIGHRGAAGHELENTLKSFQKALDLKVDIIELDVNQCASGELVVFHDKRTKRITDIRGNIRKMSLAEIKELSLPDGQKISTLQEVLDLIDKRCAVNIEIKTRGSAASLARVLEEYLEKRHWSIDQFLITSFFHRELRRIKELNADFKIGLLYYRHLRNIPMKAKKMGAYSVHLNTRYLKKKLIDKLREQNIKIFIWTVNHTHELKKARELGVDGVVTDFPDLV